MARWCHIASAMLPDSTETVPADPVSVAATVLPVVDTRSAPGASSSVPAFQLSALKRISTVNASAGSDRAVVSDSTSSTPSNARARPSLPATGTELALGACVTYTSTVAGSEAKPELSTTTYLNASNAEELLEAGSPAAHTRRGGRARPPWRGGRPP